jgi:hypothetical protein
MAASAAGEQTSQMYLYSGHDTTIMPILSSLGVHIIDWPEYVSNVVRSMPFPSHESRDANHMINLYEMTLTQGSFSTLVLFQSLRSTFSLLW